MMEQILCRSVMYVAGMPKLYSNVAKLFEYGAANCLICLWISKKCYCLIHYNVISMVLASWYKYPLVGKAVQLLLSLYQCLRNFRTYRIKIHQIWKYIYTPIKAIFYSLLANYVYGLQPTRQTIDKQVYWTVLSSDMVWK